MKKSKVTVRVPENDELPPGSDQAVGDDSEELEEKDDAIVGKALVGSLIVFAFVGLLVGGVVFYLNRKENKPVQQATVLEVPKVRQVASLDPPKVKFTDVTMESGITFKHVTGARGEKLLPETMGGGCAFFDADNDGDSDLLLINSSDWPWTKDPQNPPATAGFYLNDGKGHFTDATKGSGLDISFYGMGVAVGDYDGDGWIDLFVTTVGKDRLFKNEQGKFRDVTDEAGVGGADSEWGTSCAFFDCDNDGDLDLFVANYVRWSREIDLSQFSSIDGTNRAYGPPISFQGTFPYLYRNDGNGKFSDISEAAGVQIKNPNTGVPAGKSMGVAIVDVDDDGKLDIVVTNDTVPNYLFHNEGNGAFKELAYVSGIAVGSQGEARGAMGIGVGRIRSARSLGIVIGNFANEMTALYVSHENPMDFLDASVACGLGPATRLSLTFGVFFFDYDLDGRLDILSANGHLEEDINKLLPSQHYAQPPKLFWNCGANQPTEFLEVKDEASGPDIRKPLVGRGSAYADIDGDGDLDVVICSSGEAPRLLRNDQSLGNHWLRVKLVGPKGNREAIGANVEANVAGGDLLRREVLPTQSYLSQSELPVTFGLGKLSEVETLTIRWPDGSKQEIAKPAIDQLLVVEHGK